jgi:hypothetical protein
VINMADGEHVLIRDAANIAFDPTEGGSEEFYVMSGNRRLSGTFAIVTGVGLAERDAAAVTAATVRDLLQREPFEPFRVSMISGESHDVMHPEIAFVTAGSLILAIPDTRHPEGERLAFCSYGHIARIDVFKPSPPA